MSQACLTFSDLTLGYSRHPAVHHLNRIVRKGSLLAVVGGDGSGKSILMKTIVGLLRLMDGACSVAADTRLIYLPQQSELHRSFPARVTDLVSLGLWPRRGLLGRQDHRVAAEAHNAFRHFERDYGISFLSPQGVSTDPEASAADGPAPTDIDMMRYHVKALFLAINKG